METPAQTAPPPLPPPEAAGARGPRTTRQWVSLALKIALLALLVSYPWWFDNAPVIKDRLQENFDLRTMANMLNYMLLALGLNIVVGFAGLLDLGYVAFWAVGAYTVAWFSSAHFAKKGGDFSLHIFSVLPNSDAPGIHMSFWLVLAIVAIPAALIGIIIGAPTLRLRGDYLAIVTLGFGEIIPQIARNGEEITFNGYKLTNGPANIGPIDKPGFGGSVHDAVSWLPATFTGPNSNRYWYLLAATMLILVLIISINLRDSRLGRAWVAIREDELAASSMGIPLVRTKLWAYGVGALIGAWGGVFYGSFTGGVTPDAFAFQFSILILAMIILGGMGNVFGVMVGAAILSWLNLKGLTLLGKEIKDAGVNFDPKQYEYGFFGLILVIMMLVRPQGLIPSARRSEEFHEPEAATDAIGGTT